MDPARKTKEVSLYGLEAISAANGWAMALFGILIVLTGLWVLSTVIAQFPKGVAWLEKHGEERKQKKELLNQCSLQPYRNRPYLPACIS